LDSNQNGNEMAAYPASQVGFDKAALTPTDSAGQTAELPPTVKKSKVQRSLLYLYSAKF
jgi:hypothetical protein